METLVAAVQQRNGRLNSSPSKGFGEINCRAFESSRGLLSVPLRSYSTPVPNGSSNLKLKDGKQSRKNVKSSPIAIDTKSGEKEMTFTELWAGPAYSNSPPPTSLPMPKFSFPRRTVSLELPPVEPEIELHCIAKSAPTSPTRELDVDDCATKTLRRILNLDMVD